uniref:Uncharacterized protein n=1 Tax=Anopheles dirus TaxID=7168 RepID=A0A182NXT2_9DIPT
MPLHVGSSRARRYRS